VEQANVYNLFDFSHDINTSTLAEHTLVRKQDVKFYLCPSDPESAKMYGAYEKDAPINGGWAVMADGAVKRLDAKAFQAMPKAQL